MATTPNGSAMECNYGWKEGRQDEGKVVMMVPVKQVSDLKSHNVVFVGAGARRSGMVEVVVFRAGILFCR